VRPGSRRGARNGEQVDAEGSDATEASLARAVASGADSESTEESGSGSSAAEEPVATTRRRGRAGQCVVERRAVPQRRAAPKQPLRDPSDSEGDGATPRLCTHTSTWAGGCSEAHITCLATSGRLQYKEL